MSGGAKKVVKVDQERQPYRTELTDRKSVV